MPAMAVTVAFRALGIGRIALVNAPFFSDEADKKGATYFQDQGLEVVHASHLLPQEKVPHPNLGLAASPAELYEWVRYHVPSSAEGVFIAGNGFRSIGVIAALEEDLGLAALTANQVALWYALREARVGAGSKVTGGCSRRSGHDDPSAPIDVHSPPHSR